VIEQVADDQAEDDTAHSAAKTNKSGHRSHDGAFEQIGGKDHDERGPGLLAEEREAEKGDSE
jgi:hypothetical protein